MQIAKITTKGQVTIPVEIRRQMTLNPGDKLLFVEEDGRWYLENAAHVAIRRAQEAFSGEAERLGLRDEADVVALVKEVRRERWGSHSASDA
jgi:AbrB family looped-hinge helix DNA binding protein